MEGFKQALNKWIEVGSGEWISQALLKALKNDKVLESHFDKDFKELGRDSQEALLKLTQQVSKSAPFAWRATTEYKFWENKYNLVDHVDYNHETEEGEIITLEGYQIDEALSQLVSKMNLEQKTEESEKVIPVDSEVVEEESIDLDDVDMENLTWPRLTRVMDEIIEVSEYNDIDEAFQAEFKVMRNIGDYTDRNWNKVRMRAFPLSNVPVNGSNTVTEGIFIKYLLQEWMLNKI